MSPTRFGIWSTISAALGPLLVAPNFASLVLLLLFNPVACAMPTPRGRDSAPDTSDDESAQNKQFLVVGAVSGSVVAVAVIVLVVRWWRRREEKRERRLKEEDRMPLSASFQPGELPTLSYLPEQKSASVEGLA